MNEYNPKEIEAIFRKRLVAENKSKITIKNYTSDIRHFLGWLSYDFKRFNKHGVIAYKKYLIESKLPSRTINRRLSAIRKFSRTATHENWIKPDSLVEVANIPKPRIKKAHNHRKSFFAHSYVSKEYLHEALNRFSGTLSSFKSRSVIIRDSHFSKYRILLFTFSLVVFFAFLTNPNAQNQFRIPTSASTRTIAYQAKLLDKTGEIINTKTKIEFSLYNHQEKGKRIYRSGNCDITPSPDGIFSVIIGKECGNPIPNTIFNENQSVYLGIKVGNDKEMSPRTAIPNNTLSANSASLNGHVLGTSVNTIPYIDQNGQIMIQSEKPGLRSILNSANFIISSNNGLELHSAQSGNILIAATESGSINFQTGLLTHMTLANNGNLGLGNSVPVSKFSVGGISEFQVDASGNLVKINNVSYSWPNIQGQVGSLLTNDGNGKLTWQNAQDLIASLSAKFLSTPSADIKGPTGPTGPVGAPGDSFFTKIGNLIYPNGDNDNTSLALGGNTSASSDIYFTPVAGQNSWFNISGGFLGVGTTTPTSKLTVAGGQTSIELSTQYSERLCHSGNDSSSTQSAVLGDCVSGGSDLAEYYSTEEMLEPGDIVAPSAAGNLIIKKTFEAYQQDIIGIVSTDPATETLIGKRDTDQKQEPIALTGRAPLKVSLENGPIVIGDPITSSSKPGVGMKATRTGKIIARALENFDGSLRISTLVREQENERNTIHANSLAPYQSDSTKWPDNVGKIMVFVDSSWQSFDDQYIYKGSMDQNDSIHVDSDTEDNLTLGLIHDIKNQITNIEKALTDELNITDLKTNQLISKALRSPEDFIEYIRPVTFSTDKITSPIIETTEIIASGSSQIERITTTEIAPKNSSVIFDLSQKESGDQTKQLTEIIVKGLKEKPVVTIDQTGNATFSGQLTSDVVKTNELIADSIEAETLQSESATISGTLTAKEIQADNIKSIEERLARMNNAIEDSNALTATKSSQITPDYSEDINEIQRLLGEIKASPLRSGNYYELPEREGLQQSQLNNGQDLVTFNNANFIGQTNLYNASVTNSFTAGLIAIENQSVTALGADLKLSALSAVDILDGAVRIGREGTLTTQGAMIANGGVKTNTIQAINTNEDIAVILGQQNTGTDSGQLVNNKYKILNTLGDEVASIDASGSAYFADGISLDTFTDASDSASILTSEQNYALSGIAKPALITNNQSAGTATILKGSSEVMIYNDKVSLDSLVYITPTTPTDNKTLYISSKEVCSNGSQATCKPYFTIALSEPINADIRLNWWIIQ